MAISLDCSGKVRWPLLKRGRKAVIIGHQNVERRDIFFLKPPLSVPPSLSFVSFLPVLRRPLPPLSSPQFRLLCFALFTNCPLKFRRERRRTLSRATVEEVAPSPGE